MENKEIIHVCDSIAMQGGYERVVCDLSNIFVEKGHKVSIVCLDKPSLPFYSLDDKVQVNYSNFTKIYINNIKPALIRAILTVLLKTYNLIFLFFTLRGFSKKAIVIFHRHGFNDHLDFSRFFRNSSYDLLHMDYSNTYCNKVNRYSCFFGITRRPKKNLIVLTEKSKLEAIEDNIKNVIKINNPFVNNVFPHNQMSRTFLNVGRHGPQKNQKLLIEAFNLVHHLIPDWNLKIVGEGVSTANDLNELINHYNLSNKVFLFDSTNKPDEFFKNASVFILSSIFEGLPLVLLEAMSHGNVIISSNYKGCDEVLNISNSLLFEINDIQKLSNLMLKTANDLNLRNSLSRNAINCLSKFSKESVYIEWMKLFKND